MIVRLGTLCAFTLACGCTHAAAAEPVSSAAPQAVSATGTPVLVRAELAFVEPRDGVTRFSLGGNGELRAGKQLVGILSTDETFSFAGGNGEVTAKLDRTGRVEITAAAGDHPALPGDLNKLLHDYNGTVRSGYAIDADGTATIALARPLAFAADGTLSSGALRVVGLTAKTRRTAMFMYVLLSTIIP